MFQHSIAILMRCLPVNYVQILYPNKLIMHYVLPLKTKHYRQ